MSKNYILISFDCEGFEAIVDVTEFAPEQAMLNKLAGNSEPDMRFANMIGAMKLRARYNPQRAPEIWIIMSEDFDADSIKQLSEEDPQFTADIVRKHGIPIWRTSKPKQVIS